MVSARHGCSRNHWPWHTRR